MMMKLYLKIPDRHKPLPKLEDDVFHDFITSIYTDEAKLCNSCECIRARGINRQWGRVYK